MCFCCLQLSSYLITSLINMYIDDNAATDAISERLRDVCPSLYSMEDAVCSKVCCVCVYDSLSIYYHI